MMVVFIIAPLPQVLILSHEAASAEEAVGYITPFVYPCRPLTLLLRSARLDPVSDPRCVLFDGWQDLRVPRGCLFLCGSVRSGRDAPLTTSLFCTTVHVRATRVFHP
jgi:hypothetical protein